MSKRTTALSEEEDIRAITIALAAWLESQGIEFEDGAYACSVLAGYAIGQATSDKAHLMKGIEILQDVFRRTALQSFQKK